jgi:aspartate 1-decarboxylase
VRVGLGYDRRRTLRDVAAARLVNEGDEIIIMAFAYAPVDEAREIRPKVALVDEGNSLTSLL